MTSFDARMPRTDESYDAQEFGQHLRGKGFETIETHISRVYLGERDVFKMKKPVDLGFLDFTSLEKRQRACEAEVQLNRRLAADVYIGVVPVTRSGTRIEIQPEKKGLNNSFDDEPEIVDWAVHMRRLPDADRADTLLQRGQLTREHISALAKKLSDFHSEHSSNAHIASFGGKALIQRNLEENFEQMRPLIERYIGADAASEIESWQRHFLDARQQLFSQRLQEGKVRDGHGDLRLEHVYFEGGRPDGQIAILDCIEFNERFRYADVCADLAFLTMDLASSGGTDLSEALLSDYARYANDYGIYPLVDFYQSYRAFVRGKIFALTEALSPHSHGDRESLKHLARHHFLLAQASERRPLKDVLIVAVGGWIATGKSTIATEIAAQLQVPLVSSDLARKWLLQRPLLEQADEDAFAGGYSKAATQQTYTEVLRRAEDVVSSGRGVVLDASFRTRTQRALARRLASEHGLEFLFVECMATKSVCRERLEQRETTERVSEGTLDVFEDFVAAWEDVQELPPAQHSVLRTDRPLVESIAELRKHLEPWLAQALSST